MGNFNLVHTISTLLTKDKDILNLCDKCAKIGIQQMIVQSLSSISKMTVHDFENMLLKNHNKECVLVFHHLLAYLETFGRDTLHAKPLKLEHITKTYMVVKTYLDPYSLSSE